MNRNILMGLASFLFLSAPAAQAAVTLTTNQGTLVIKGDSATDTVDIDGLPALGYLQVRINLGPASLFNGIRDIKAKMGSGDDVLKLHGLSLGGDVKVLMGQGDDVIGLDNTLTSGETASSFIGGNVQLGMGGQSQDLVSIGSTDATKLTHIGGRLRIQGAADVDLNGNGATVDIETSDVTIGGDLIIDSPFSADVNLDNRSLDLDDVNVGGGASIKLGDGADNVEITDSHFVRKVSIQMGAGDDLMTFLGTNEFNNFFDLLIVNGQGGSDTFDSHPNNYFAKPPLFKAVEIIL